MDQYPAWSVVVACEKSILVGSKATVSNSQAQKERALQVVDLCAGHGTEVPSLCN